MSQRPKKSDLLRLAERLIKLDGITEDVSSGVAYKEFMLRSEMAGLGAICDALASRYTALEAAK